VPDQLLAAVTRALADGHAARCERQEQAAALRLVETLTPRERQVCDLVSQGMLNKQIAAELGTSEKTVKAQRGRATRKLKVTSTAALLELLRRAGV
jgi:FixJ family two-component response regulator